MHNTSLISGKSFAESYGLNNGIVVDIGGKNVNGSLRLFFKELGMHFVSLDMEIDPSVDIVMLPGENLPFKDGSVDLIVCTSCFEHDPCFWLTFKEMTRIIKQTGYIYINAPTSGPYHTCPGDNWRFYSDAGQALAYWSGKKISNENVYPVKVIESFIILGSMWNDFVCVWQRVDVKDIETNIVISNEVIKNIGILEKTINNYGLKTIKKLINPWDKSI